MATRTIDIKLNTSANLGKLREANAELAKLAYKFKDFGPAVRQSMMAASRETYSFGNITDETANRTILSAKQIEAAWAKVMATAPAEATKGMSAVKQIVSGAVKGIGGAFSKIGQMFLSGGIWGAIAAAAIKAVSSIWSYYEKKAELAAKRTERLFKENFDSIKDEASKIDKAFDSTVATLNKVLSRYDAMVDKVKELTKAEIEHAKQIAIANGANPETVRAAAEDLSAQVDYEAELKKQRELIANQQKIIKAAADAKTATEAQIKAANEKLAEAEKDYDTKREEYAKSAVAKASALMAALQQDSFKGLTDEQIAKERESALAEFEDTEEGLRLREKIRGMRGDIENIKTDEKAVAAADDAKAKIEQAQKSIAILEEKQAAREIAVQNEIAEKAKKDAEERANMEKAAADERLKAELAAANKIAKERERHEQELHQQRMEQIRKEQDAEKKKAEALKTTSAAAQSEFDRAFAMYRDPAAAAAQIGEERDYAADLKRLHKDASRYAGKWRIDELSRLMAAGDTQGMADTLEGWRKSSRFSPQVEAMVRASAAEQTKTTVEDELRKIETNTADLSAKLEELISMKGA